MNSHTIHGGDIKDEKNYVVSTPTVFIFSLTLSSFG